MAPPDEKGRFTDKDQTIILDSKSNHDWIVPRRVMCAFFWIGIIMLFTGIILLVTSKHKGDVYRSWGGILLGLGFCLLLICLILCLHAYCVITITEDEPLTRRAVPPPPPSVVMNGRKPRNKGEGRPEAADESSSRPPSRPNTPHKNAKPVQLLIVDREDVDNLESGKPLYFKDDINKPNGQISPKSENIYHDNGSSRTGLQQTATVSHPVLGDVHVSVRPANPAFGSPSSSSRQYDVESTELSQGIRNAQGPVPPDIPLHLLEHLDERRIEQDAVAGGAAANSPREGHADQHHAQTGDKVIIPTKYATAFSPFKGGAGSAQVSPVKSSSYYSQFSPVKTGGGGSSQFSPVKSGSASQYSPGKNGSSLQFSPGKSGSSSQFSAGKSGNSLQHSPVKSSGSYFSPLKGRPSRLPNDPEGVNTYIGYQDGLDLHAFPVGQVLTAKPPQIPGRHSSQITAHVIPIPTSHYKNYPIGIVPPPPSHVHKMLSQTMGIKEEDIKRQLVPNGDPIKIKMPENYIQRIPPEHDHEGRRFSQPVVVYLNPTQNLGLSQLSVYDNVQYVWAEPPAGGAAHVHPKQ